MNEEDIKADSSLLQTVSRAIAVLRCFDGGSATLSLADLTRMMDLNKVTVFRLATTLVAEGVLAFDKETARYRVSFGLIALGRKLLDRDGLRDCAHLSMEQARVATGETVCLSVRERWEQVVIHALPSPQPVRYVLEVASRGPVYNGAAGQCLLAALSSDQVERLVAETGLEPTAGNSVTTREALRAKIDAIRKNGFGVSLGERISEAAATAAPIYSADGDVAASLSIIMPLSRAEGAHLDDCARIVRETAETISREMSSNKGRAA